MTPSPSISPSDDPWALLRSTTQARIGLGHSGHAMPTAHVLAFRADHAAARDALHAELDLDALAASLRAGSGAGRHGNESIVEVASRATSRGEYLRRPDLGRRLRADDADRLRTIRAGAPSERDPDLSIVLCDGLSSTAVATHAAPFLRAVERALGPGVELGPLVVATQARVALGDEVGGALGSRAVLVLIGERPGLSVPDSLGAYLTFNPEVGRLDSERNCVSNIRPPHGLSYDAAARTIAALFGAARALGRTGVDLKDPTELDPGKALD
jgi:ethanolamine ammonia-lyase small subunit